MSRAGFPVPSSSPTPATAPIGCSSSNAAASSRCCNRAVRRRPSSSTSAAGCSPAASRVCSASRSTRCTKSTAGSSSTTRDRRRRLVIAEYHASAPTRTSPARRETVMLTIPHPVRPTTTAACWRSVPDKLPLHRRRRRRRRQRPAEQRAESRRAARQDPAHRRRSRRTAACPYVVADRQPVLRHGTAGRDEIFAYGMRNPWRFSFDRLTGQLWVADVGQGAREEVDTPIVSGGNYGWRVFEGFSARTTIPRCAATSGYIAPPLRVRACERPLLDHRRIRLSRHAECAAGRHLRLRRLLHRRDLRTGRAQRPARHRPQHLVVRRRRERRDLRRRPWRHRERIVSTTPCSFSIAPTSQSSVARAAAPTRRHRAAGCDWTAAGERAWINITSGQAAPATERRLLGGCRTSGAPPGAGR